MRVECVPKFVNKALEQRGDRHLCALIDALCEQVGPAKVIAMIAGHCYHHGKPRLAGIISKAADKVGDNV